MAPAKLPLLFIGHGSPMNAIENNKYTQSLEILGRALPRPEVILCVSAHWNTRGTWVTAMENPKTIHDFYGFPKPLFDVQYPAPGSPQTAKLVQETLGSDLVQLDHKEWGLDHGAWSVLRHLFPKADIPVVQLSFDPKKNAAFHYELGQKLKPLREKGVMIIGSGNVVHNLQTISWEADAPPADWAIQFDDWIKGKLNQGDFSALNTDYLKTEAGRLSVPTPDHYFPLQYVLGASDPSDTLCIEFEGIQNKSISMLSISLGFKNYFKR